MFQPLKAPLKEVNFDNNVYQIDGPVVVPDMDIPNKPDTKAEKGKRFLFFKKKKKVCTEKYSYTRKTV